MPEGHGLGGQCPLDQVVPSRPGRRPSESISLTSPVEAAKEETLRAGVPELRRAAGRLSELLEGSVY